ncbi:MAG: ABC transporter permease [Thermomicrobiales bacterium]
MLSYVRLEILRMLRNWRYLIQALGAPLFLYVLFSRQLAGTSASAALMVSMAAYGAIGAAFAVGGPRLAAERASGWTRQLRVTPLPAYAYLIAKSLAALALALPAIVLVELCGRFVNHVALPLTTWLAVLPLLLLGSVPIALLGVLLGYLLDTDTAYVGTSLVYFGLALLGGLWFPLDTAPRLVRLIGPTLPSHQLADLAQRAVAGSLPRVTTALELVVYAGAFGALVVWLYRRDESRGWV